MTLDFLYTLKEKTFFPSVFLSPLSKCIKKSSNFHLQNKKYIGFQYLVLCIWFQQIQWITPQKYFFFGNRKDIYLFTFKSDTALSAGPPDRTLATQMPLSQRPSLTLKPKSSQTLSLNKVTLWTSVGTGACLDLIVPFEGVGDDKSDTHGGPFGVVTLLEEYLKYNVK